MDRSLLARATDSSEAPTPGYLYVDLAKQAGANPSVCQDMARYLTNRLSTKQSPYVKMKCCKVLAKLCEQVPRNQFRRVLAQDAAAVSAIKAALQFRGPLDPLQGDAKNEAVRVAAREALDAVYASAPETPGAGGISSSYGASPHNANGAVGGPRRMEGIGNPMFADPRLAPPQSSSNIPERLPGALKEAGEVIVGMIRDPLARNIGQPQYPSVPSQGHSGDLPGYNRSGRPPPGSSELSRQTGGQWTMASNRGPGAYNSNPYYQQRASAAPSGQPHTSAASGGVGGSWANAPATSIASQAREPAYGTPSITITPGHTPATSGATSDGSYEKNLIMELCPPGGLKPVPPAEKLQDFIKAVPTLNADWICPVLLDCLEDGQPWIIRAKALHVMEAAIAHGQTPDGRHPYRDFFYACAEEISPLGSHPRAAIAEPAKRVLDLLGVQIVGGGAANTGQSTSAAPLAAPAPNLLDFDEPAAPPASAPPPPPSATPSASSSGGGMFGGMQVKGKSAAAAPAPSAASPAPDLFDFGAPTPAPAAAAPVASPADPFGETAPQSTTAPSSMFAQMSMKDDSSNAAASSEAPSAGSAFGFINASEEKKTSTPAPTPSTASFDPTLLYAQGAPQPMAGGMQLSPQQMQALAYQNMMMQQQMQQMQMAMMRGTAPPMPPIYRQGSGQTKFSMQQQPKEAKKDDKKFDFVKDAIISEKKH